MKHKTHSDNAMKNKIVTIPNALSLFRLCLIPVIIWLYCVKQDYLWTAYILLLSGATDVVDGFIARHFHMISDLGKVLDPVADKLTQGAMLFCLLTRFPLMLAPIVLMLVKEVYMAISGILFVRKTGVVPGANWHGKAATVLLYAMMLLHVFWHDIPPIASNLSIAVCLAMMLLSLILYGRRNAKAFKGGTAEQA